MVCDLDADARMMIIMQLISGPQNLVRLVLELRKQDRHCSGETATCQAAMSPRMRIEDVMGSNDSIRRDRAGSYRVASSSGAATPPTSTTT